MATLSLGLGVGVNTTLYSVFRTVFLVSPTSTEPGRLVRIEPGNSNQIAYPNYRDIRPGDTFEGLAAYARVALNLHVGGEIQKVSAGLVSPEFFAVLGVQPSTGRTFAASEDRVAVLTDEFARRHNAAPGAVLNLNEHIFTVVGVLARDYRPVTGAMGPQLYVPLSEAVEPGLNKRSRAFLTLLGRLNENAEAPQAQAAFTAQAKALEALFPAENAGFGRPAHVFPLSGLGSWRTRDMPMASLLAIGAVPFVMFGLVLVIACANVAGLLLARGAARRRDIAIRLAIGASRWRVIGTLLSESLLLSVFGSMSGLVLTFWLCRLVSVTPLPLSPGPLKVEPDLYVLLYALALAVITAVACGLTPALASTKPRLTEALKLDAASSGHRLTGRRILVIGQVALSTVLLFISTLFLRSLSFIGTVDPGFDMEHVVTAHIDLDRDRYPGEQRLAFASRASKAVAGIGGVVSASVTNLIPLGGDMYTTKYDVEGRTVARVETYMMNVGPDYFRTLDTPLRLGREFTTADRSGAAAVAIVNQAFVRVHGLDAAAVGSRVRNRPEDPWREIVGVVADSKYGFFGETPRPIVYQPYLQAGGDLWVVARTLTAGGGMIPAIRHALGEVDRYATVEVRTIRESTSLEFSFRRMGTLVLGAIGGLGLALALVGLYGVMSYNVHRRTAEIGVRMSLGATRPSILWMVLRSGVAQVATGVGIGTALSLAAARPLAFLMSGIAITDPVTIAATAVLFLGAGMAASYFPARRATQVDPMVMLRYQ